MQDLLVEITIGAAIVGLGALLFLASDWGRP